MMTLRRLLVLTPIMLAVLVAMASADPINTYSFTATTKPYYQFNGCCSPPTLISPGITLNGTFSFDAGDNTITAWSVDLSPLEGYTEQGGKAVAAVDVNGSYVFDNTNSYFNSQNSNQVFDFEAYPGDGAYFSNISVGTSVGSNLSLWFDNPLPTVGNIQDSFNANSSGFFQCQSCSNGGDNYNAYFASGSATLVTPEPPSWTLAGAGALLLGGMLLWSDRRRQHLAAGTKA